MQSEVSNAIDWSVLTAPKEEVYAAMAKNVIEQMENVPEDQRAIVAMATMTKLLVENVIFTSMVSGNEHEN